MSELIYGRRAVLETMRANRRRIYRLWLEGDSNIGENIGDSGVLDEIRAAANAASIPTRSVAGGVFDRLARQKVNAQGTALEVDAYPYVDVHDILQCADECDEPPFILILDHLQDPQNLGALIRTAEAMGVHGIVTPDRRAASITPAVTNASAGAVEHINLAQVANINQTIDRLKGQNVWVIGLDSGDDVPVLAPDMLNGALALVIGNEGAGLSRLTREKCDLVYRLPMFGCVDSLNAAVAGSIVLYLARQVRMQGPSKE